MRLCAAGFGEEVGTGDCRFYMILERDGEDGEPEGVKKTIDFAHIDATRLIGMLDQYMAWRDERLVER